MGLVGGIVPVRDHKTGEHDGVEVDCRGNVRGDAAIGVQHRGDRLIGFVRHPGHRARKCDIRCAKLG